MFDRHQSSALRKNMEAFDWKAFYVLNWAASTFPALCGGECARCSIHEPKANNIFLFNCAPYPAYKAGLAVALPVMPDLIRHLGQSWIPAFAGMTTLTYLFTVEQLEIPRNLLRGDSVYRLEHGFPDLLLFSFCPKYRELIV